MREDLWEFEPTETAAEGICAEAEQARTNSYTIGPLHLPEVARPAYAWKCPDRLAGLDTAIAEAQVERVEAQAEQAEEQRRAAAELKAGISAEEFAQIQNGMTVEEVQWIVGGPGEVVVESELAGYTGLILSWYGEAGYPTGGNASMQFQNGRLISKSQAGL